MVLVDIIKNEHALFLNKMFFNEKEADLRSRGRGQSAPTPVRVVDSIYS